MTSEVSDQGDRRTLILRRMIFVVTLAFAAGSLQAAAVWSTSRQAGPWGTLAAWHALVAAVLISGLAALMGRHLFFLPITRARQALAASERLYRLIADDSADIVLKMRGTAFELLGGVAFLDLLGIDRATLRNASPLAFVHPADRPALRRYYCRLSKRKPCASAVVRLLHADGHFIWADIRLHRLDTFGAPMELLVTIRDVSARHHEAEELRQATILAQSAQADADRANAAKTDFLACMSHEIRTPLNAVIGFAGLLAAEEGSPKVRLYAERIKASGDAVLTIVDDILEFSRIEAGALDLEPAPFALPNVIDECLSIVQQAASAKNLSLHVNLQDRLARVVLGDAARLRQILLNLLNNAVKFTHEGSVLLDIRRDRTEGRQEHLRFSVVDTGIGIEPADLPRLFGRFQQIDGSIRRTYGGTGLGLAISKKLVELMGGEITVESRKGVGSTFAFTIPLPSAHLAETAPVVAPTTTLKPCRILLAEDVPINQDLALHILRAHGHEVDVVSNGAEAIMAVQDAPYDIVLMDVQMPYVDGVTATYMIRELPRPACDVPIVAITANVLPEQTAAVRAAGMIDIIHKPFSPQQILATLERVLAGVDLAPADSGSSSALPKLVAVLGAPKVAELLNSLAQSLSERFDADPATADGRALLKKQAHAGIAACGILGFTAFANSCRAFETAPEDCDFTGRLEALRHDARRVISMARDLAANGLEPAPLPLAPTERIRAIVS